MIATQSERLAQITEEVLLASQLDRGEVAVEHDRVDVAHLARRVVETLQAHLIVPVTLKAPGAAFATGDRDRIEQILINLLDNAAKYSPEGGAITVSVRSLGAEVRVSVADTGTGIPEAEREHVFDRYWQAIHTRRAGAGLGLFIVKGIVEAHGGRAWAEPGPGGGACLCFTLPTYSSSLRIQQPDART